MARQTLARRNADYTDEVRRLLDAALEVMRRTGTASKARVADIVGAAGLSNQAFYRHFESKDALVTALLTDGAERLRDYVAHQMEKAATPQDAVRRWVVGVLSQTDDNIAMTTLAVLHNAGSGDDAHAANRHFATRPLALLLREPFTALGSAEPDLAAAFAAHAVLGVLSDHLWERTRPTRNEVDRLVELCLRGAHRQ